MCTTDQPIAHAPVMTPQTFVSRLTRWIARTGLAVLRRRSDRRHNPFSDLDDYMRRDIGQAGYYDPAEQLNRDRMIAMAMLYSRH
ncbi:hypothetical protein [Rhizobium halophytocola]|uniref:DUF1127 domain-containing protein n=1 Tax=Rhizobium halophytocola TaxID=735519 RepID=A0ABS4DYT2_9HYPH|nr:hypothetical protein [Rhizobium halophytocola]MBP1850842.1 hypothetical protein [Rhizobium halophytocola]